MPQKIFSLLLTLFSFTSLAQITGTITDENGEPLPNASVALYQGDKLINGIVSNVDGSFSLTTNPGEYLLEVSFISYETRLIPLTVNEKGEKKDLGSIGLTPLNSTLDEVTIEAEAKLMQFEHDKRVFNVAKDLSNVGSNASDILNNIPSVNVDIEGNISLRGSQGVRILINGKPSGLIGSDPATALQQLQGNMIEKIEVITNPSARYDAEGDAGIINIILKDQNQSGFNGSFEVTGGYPDNYGVGGTANYRKDKFNFFTNLSLNYRKSPGGGFFDQQTTNPDTSFGLVRNREQKRGGLNAALRLGTDYYFNSKESVTGSFLYRPSQGNNYAFIEYLNYDENDNLSSATTREDNELETERLLETDIHYEKNFADKDHKWTADFRFQDSDDREESDIVQSSAEQSANVLQFVNNQEDEQNILFQTDYVKPFTEDRSFETGARTTMRTIINAYQVTEENQSGGVDILPEFTNSFNYQENIFAAYAIYNDAFSDFTYQLGVRTEYTGISTQLGEGEANDREFLNLFPSAFLTWEINTLSDFQLSYSRRISRPGFRNLLPFFSFSDSRVFYSGNANLNPEFADNYEMGYVRYWENASLYSGIYYRHRTGVIERIRTVDGNGDNRIFPVNLSVQDAYGFEFNYQHDFYKWWSVNGNLNLYRAITTGNYEGISYNADNFTSQGRIMNRMQFWKSNFQLSFNFRGPQTTTQGNALGIYTMDIGWSKDILNDRATIALSVRDLFNTRKRRTFTNGVTDEGGTFESYDEFQWRQRQITLSLTYRINQKKKFDRNSERGSGDSGGDLGDF